MYLKQIILVLIFIFETLGLSLRGSDKLKNTNNYTDLYPFMAYKIFLLNSLDDVNPYCFFLYNNTKK